MSHISSGILGMVAAAVTFGAIQYASGSDLRGTIGMPSAAIETTAVAPPTASAVNRAAKGDRILIKTGSAFQTMSFGIHGISDTSVLLRVKPIPVKTEIILPRAIPVATTLAAGEKPAVACEPPVSILSEVAKLLQPGRCIT